jgi:hypothetical protein
VEKRSKKQKLVKGMSSAVLLSILIHAGLFLLAGMLVVFTVVKQKEVEFEPPQAVERPKMKLKKPKVRIKKSSRPKSTTRIATTVKRAEMPNIELPEMSGMGDGLGDGIGDGFDMMPSIKEVTTFGSEQSIGNDFVGTFYDLNRDRNGRNVPALDQSRYMDIVNSFLNSDWQTSRLTPYYQSPKKLYATTFMMPMMPSILAPYAFGEDETGGFFWLAHYKGQLVHKEGITFRFVGKADDILIVRVNGEIVLIANHDEWIYRRPIGQWQSSSADSRKWRVGGSYAIVGDWITLEPGVPLEMEVLIGEIPGGGFGAMLCVQEEDVEYERSYGGGIILPIFKTEQPSLDLIDEIYNFLVEDGADVTGDPVFRDYDLGGQSVTAEGVKTEPQAPEDPPEDEPLRVWSLADGKSLQAEFVNVIGDKVVLKGARGNLRKIPLAQVSAEDRKFIELAQPPTFNFSFFKSTSQQKIKLSPFAQLSTDVPKIIDYVFTANLEQTSVRSYGSELQVEFFAIGEEIDGDNYILLDRQQSSFIPDKANERSHRFSGKAVRMMDYTFGRQRRGEKYGGYLITVTDERGRIIDYGSSHKWLYENLEKLKEIPVGRHFNKAGNRVHPPRPIRNY